MPGHPEAGRGHLFQIDAGLDAQAVEHPHQVLGREVAGGAAGVGTSAEATGAGVEGGDALLEGGVGVGQGLAIGVVEVHGQLVAGHARIDERRDQPADVAGRAHTDGVAEAELVGPEVEEALADLDHLVDRDVPLPRVAEAHRDIGANVEPGGARPGHGGLEHLELPVQAAVEVLLGEGLRGTAEDRDVPATQLEGAVEPALVGDQHRELTALVAEDLHQLCGVGELGHPLRVDEAGGLDDGEPRRHQPPDELGLDLGRHQRLLVLQAVPRADLVDRHPLREPRDVIRFARHGRRFV